MEGWGRESVFRGGCDILEYSKYVRTNMGHLTQASKINQRAQEAN